jgi:hypothetical protein
MEAFKETKGGYFPNIRQLLLILVLPVTTSTSERSFSSLKRIKSYLRTTMGENRLNGLSLLNIHHHIDIKPEEVIDLFAKQHSKHYNFVYKTLLLFIFFLYTNIFDFNTFFMCVHLYNTL